MIHPSQYDLGRPFDDISAMHTETMNQAVIGASVAASANGLRVTAGSTVNDNSSVQRVHEVVPASGRRIMVAGRVLLGNAASSKFYFGMWTTDTNPFSGEPSDGAYFFMDYPNAGVVGRSRKDGSATSTSQLFAFSSSTYVDLAVVLHGTSLVDFIHKLSADKDWKSSTVATNVPGTGDPMRPSFAILRAASGSNLYADIRSFHVAEEE